MNFSLYSVNTRYFRELGQKLNSYNDISRNPVFEEQYLKDIRQINDKSLKNTAIGLIDSDCGIDKLVKDIAEDYHRIEREAIAYCSKGFWLWAFFKCVRFFFSKRKDFQFINFREKDLESMIHRAIERKLELIRIVKRTSNSDIYQTTETELKSLLNGASK